MWLQRAPLAKRLLLQDGPWQWALLFFQLSQALAGATAESTSRLKGRPQQNSLLGRAFLPHRLHPPPHGRPGQAPHEPAPAAFHVSVLSIEFSPENWAPTRFFAHTPTRPHQNHLLDGVMILAIKHGLRCLFHHPPLCCTMHGPRR